MYFCAVNINTAQIFKINSAASFNEIAISIFRHQSENCGIYKSYLHHLNIDFDKIEDFTQIPFLPIDFFKSQQITSYQKKPDVIFTSSGTTGQITSKHFVNDVNIYQKSFNTCFNKFYGSPKNTCILALLPSYLERQGSSLIYMVDDLLNQSEHPLSGYFLHDLENLYHTLLTLKKAKQKTILIGVTYALLDFIEHFKLDFKDLIVMETGGMKGKRKEMIRSELHQILSDGFGVAKIHSEYGMTELLSQAYSTGDGLFNCPPWMKILLRDTSDPLSLLKNQQSGGINVIDLANINSCAFIATQDLGKVYSDGGFEILGRFDNADIRGCNLLVQ